MRAITVGQQFQKGTAHRWTDTDGRERFHSVQALYEVTEVTPDTVTCVMVEVLEEFGRPTSPHDVMIPTPGVSRTTFTTAGFATAVQRERVTLLREGHQVGRRS